MATNQQIASILQEIGFYLQIEGANHFRTIAYQNAVETIENLGQELHDIYRQDPDQLSKLPSIGQDLAQKMSAIIETGQCQYHQDFIKKYGHGLIDILKIRSIGPKKVKLFYDQLGIDSIEKLKQAAETNQLSQLPRMGKKSESEILAALSEHQKYHRRLLLNEALEIAEAVIKFLSPLPHIQTIQYAGSLRRGKSTIGDIDILTCPKKPKDSPIIIDQFHKFDRIDHVIASGPTKSSAILNNGVQIDLRVVEQKSYGAALHYFTGSKEHNVLIRDIAKKKNHKINEYGLYQIKGQQEIYKAGETESEIYQYLGYDYIPPQLRENHGEFEAAAKHKLPHLIQISDLAFDARCHIKPDDHKAAIARYHQLGIKSAINAQHYQDQQQAINHHDQQKDFFQPGLICQITPEGQLNCPDKIIQKFPHIFAYFPPSQRQKNPTATICQAIKNTPLTILIHPTGRLLNQTPEQNFNIETILTTLRDNQKNVEVTGDPTRLDLPDHYCLRAGKINTKIALSSAAKSPQEINQINFATWTAQRGWLEKKHLLNCQPQQ